MSRWNDDYHFGVIGNGCTCALIDPDATIVFCCLPDFDSGTVFASLLDDKRGGSFGIEMTGGRAVDQAYESNTNILVTRFEGETGSFEVTDFMPRYMEDERTGELDVAPDVVRILRPLGGRPRLRIHFDPQLDYGLFPTTTAAFDGGIKATTVGTSPTEQEIYESAYLYTDLRRDAVLGGTEIELTDTRFLLLTYHDKVQRVDRELIHLMLQRTRSYWLLWSARTHRPEPYGEQVLRSALTLKMLQFSPSGAIVAAGTTSLPETVGEERNWDYRFCWIRDASMTVSVLRKLGHPEMARIFIDWMARSVPTKDDALQIMYGIRGEKKLEEIHLDHLAGYLGSRPVRIGNSAYHQEQHDMYGVLLDVIYQDLEGRLRSPERLDRIWTRVRASIRTVERRWCTPDRGIWEIRGEKRHFVFSKVLCWVAIDRAIRIARMLEKHQWADGHLDLLQAIHDDVCAKGWNPAVGAFVQYYGSTELDAANLLLAEYGFIEANDPRFVATVDQTMATLGRNELMYRYRNEDDFGKPRSAFAVCSFWLVKALASMGRKREARARFEKLLALANRHGLYGEDFTFDTKRQLGNFPQAYCHIALVDCALALAGDDDDDGADLISY